MQETNPRVDAYLARINQWQAESEKLRQIILDCGLTEDLKWGKPCYAFDGGNVVIIQGFKAYCALLFFKGYLLSDPNGVLKKTGENTVVGRQLRFTSVAEIVELEAVVKAYIDEAIAVEKAGLKVDVEIPELIYPEEFLCRLDESPTLRAAFEALTPGRQKAYHIYFTGAKQAKTRESRIDKCIPLILEGKGLNDR